jgi:hypothetical protein
VHPGLLILQCYKNVNLRTPMSCHEHEKTIQKGINVLVVLKIQARIAPVELGLDFVTL